MTILLTVLMFLVHPSHSETQSCISVFASPNALETYWIKGKTTPLSLIELHDLIDHLFIPDKLRTELYSAVESGFETKKTPESREQFALSLTKYFSRLAGSQNQPSKKYPLITSIRNHLKKIKYGFYFIEEDFDTFPEYFYPGGERLRTLYQKGSLWNSSHGEFHREFLSLQEIEEVVEFLDISASLKNDFSRAVKNGFSQVQKLKGVERTRALEIYFKRLSDYIALLAASENMPELMATVEESLQGTLPRLRRGELPDSNPVFSESQAGFFFPRQVPQ